MTVEGRHHKHGYTFRSYYDAAGLFFSMQSDQADVRVGDWRVESDGRICIRWHDATENLCRNIVKTLFGRYKKVLFEGGGKRVVIVSYEAFSEGTDDDLHSSPVP